MSAYTGTKITGTSTTAKVFRNSDVRRAAAGDTYKNKSTGHVYRCTEGGGPSDAKWRYVRTDAVRKPEKGVGLSAPTRRDGGSWAFDAQWTVPKALSNDRNGARADGLDVKWRVAVSGGGEKAIEKHGSAAVSRTSASVNLNSLDADKPARVFRRSDFHPLGKLKASSVSLTVTPYNAYGFGEPSTRSVALSAPRKPELSEPEINQSGTVTCAVTTDAGEDARERYRTRYLVEVLDSSGSGQWEAVSDYVNADTSHTMSHDVANWQVAGKYVKVRFRARAEGLAGDSAWGSRTHVVGWPNAATIDHSGVSVPGRTADAIATFPIRVNADANHVTDRVVLQKLVNVDAATEAEATAMTESWADTDYVDDGNCVALACSVGDLLPDRGKRTWVRVKSWHDIEGIFYTYSEPYEVSALFTSAPTPTDDLIAVLDAGQGSTGSSYRVTCAWDADGTDDATGTQLSWSQEPDAWESTDPPETFEFAESDGPVTVGSTTYRGSRTLVVKGLDEGEPAYIRARRYTDDSDGNRTYGPLSAALCVVPTVAPSDVVLAAPAYAARGAGIQFTWAYGGGGTQRAWQLVDAPTGAVIAEGSDSFGSATVPAQRYSAFLSSGALSAYVRVSTGGVLVASEPRSVAIADPPEVSVGSIADLAAQPLSVPLSCSAPGCSATVTVTALGATRPTPAGTDMQPAGDAVWSGTVDPVWSASAGAYSATVELPAGLRLLDGGRYAVEATATDRATGMRSEAARAEFSVDWARKAPLPGDVQLEAYVEVGGDGKPTRACAISLVPPEDGAEGDVYDVYRLTHEGAALIGEGYPTECGLVDSYAAFGEASTSYRVACRTPDGDVAWADFDYQLDGACLRLDFQGARHGWCELPYNLSLKDSYAKSYSGRMHMDGSRGGGWDEGAERTSSFATDVMRIADPQTVAALYDMAQTAGPVFVRTPAGAAFEADVQMRDAAVDSAGVLSCSLSVTECGLTGEFMLPPWRSEDMDGGA